MALLFRRFSDERRRGRVVGASTTARPSCWPSSRRLWLRCCCMRWGASRWQALLAALPRHVGLPCGEIRRQKPSKRPFRGYGEGTEGAERGADEPAGPADQLRSRRTVHVTPFGLPVHRSRLATRIATIGASLAAVVAL